MDLHSSDLAGRPLREPAWRRQLSEQGVFKVLGPIVTCLVTICLTNWAIDHGWFGQRMVSLDETKQYLISLVAGVVVSVSGFSLELPATVKKQRDEARNEIERVRNRLDAIIGRLAKTPDFTDPNIKGLSVNLLQFLRANGEKMLIGQITRSSVGNYVSPRVAGLVPVDNFGFHLRRDFCDRFASYVLTNMAAQGAFELTPDGQSGVLSDDGRQVLEQLSRLVSHTS